MHLMLWKLKFWQILAKFGKIFANFATFAKLLLNFHKNFAKTCKIEILQNSENFRFLKVQLQESRSLVPGLQSQLVRSLETT